MIWYDMILCERYTLLGSIKWSYWNRASDEGDEEEMGEGGGGVDMLGQEVKEGKRGGDWEEEERV